MKKLFFIILLALSLSFSSCMMMMPGHMSGSMQEGHNHANSNGKTDPVCGKQVDDNNAFNYTYQGDVYYFDTEQCLSVFKSNPDHFRHKSDTASQKKTWAKIGLIGGGVLMTTMMILMLTNAF